MQYLKKLKIDDYNNCISLDMVRFNFVIQKNKISDFGSLMRWATTTGYINYKNYKSFKLFAYKELFSFQSDNSEQFTLGFGLVTGCANDLQKGFIEFNPNKSYYFVKPFLKQLKIIASSNIETFELVRFDLALDLEIERSLVFLLRDDKRRYMKHNTLISSNNFDLTEYLGTRNTGGFVKLYNKQIESNLDRPLTRLEITLDDTSFEVFSKRMPKLYFFDTNYLHQNFDEDDKVILSLMLELGSFERINFLKRTRKQKFKQLLDSKIINIKEEHFNFIINLIEDIKNVIL